MTAVPGFASRSTDVTFHQFPHRDEAAMADIESMNTPGWSNENHDGGTPVTEADSKVVADATVEDKSVTKKTTARKSAPKKG